MDKYDDLRRSSRTAHTSSVEEVTTGLHTDLLTGLSTSEAERRRQQYGLNRLRPKLRVPAWRRFLLQFLDPQIYLLLSAAVVTGFVGKLEGTRGIPHETYIILAIIFLNALLSFVQEDRAERALTSLEKMMPAQTNAIRDSVQQGLPIEDLVPGDLITLGEGDLVPADARLAETHSFLTMEASLTGESLPVHKHAKPIAPQVNLGDRSNMVFAGTVVVSGTAKAIVTATGSQTEFGKIADLIASARNPPTPLQQQLETLSKQMGAAVLIITACITTILLTVRGTSDPKTILSILLFAIALAVAATPEGLAAITTLVLAIGVQRMANRGAIVKQLPAVETLGSTTVIASDKTGTMTRNEMTVSTLLTASGRVNVSGVGYTTEGTISSPNGNLPSEKQTEELRQLLFAATLVNNAQIMRPETTWKVQGDPTETALLIAAHKFQIVASEARHLYPRLTEMPFSSERKMMSTIHRLQNDPIKAFIFSKGAPDVLLEHCTQILIGGSTRPLTSEHRLQILRDNAALAQGALRLLGVASRRLSLDEAANPFGLKETDAESELTFLGLIGMIDPPRPEVRSAIRQARTAGIRTILITGDHPSTAVAVAKELDITHNSDVLSGAELDAISDEMLSLRVRQVEVYARVRPEHKLRIVQALQRNHEIVAMTGDGVNDAPALKAAHIGIAMGISGTAVSKEAADLVLTDDNFATIVVAVEEGRVIFDNIQKFLRYLLATNVGEILTLFFSAVILSIQKGPSHTLVLPLTAAQILWINLITDSAPAFALGMDPASPDIMKRLPRSPKAGIVNYQMLSTLLLSAVVMAASSLGVFFIIASHESVERRRTMTFTTLILCQLFNSISARSHTNSVFQHLSQNCWLWASILFSLALQILLLNVPNLQRLFGLAPLNLSDWFLCGSIASIVLWVSELSIFVGRYRAHKASAAAK